ncbi:MAG: beta-eliminating lyase-related protein, partial [Bacteroidota bacterium]
VALENTVNRGGGSTYSLGEIKSIRALCEKNSLSLHLDGARIFNALVARQQSPAELGQYFDSISVCLSKGLGCPVGSVLLGSKALIQKALRIRKVFGGGMRQAGYLAAAGIYALDYHIERLAEDHKRAKIIGTHLEQKAFVKAVLPVETNIVLFNLESYELLKELDQFCQRFDIQISAMDKTRPRVVCHLDFNDKMLEKFLQVIDSFDQEYQAKSRKVQALS